MHHIRQLTTCATHGPCDLPSCLLVQLLPRIRAQLRTGCADIALIPHAHPCAAAALGHEDGFEVSVLMTMGELARVAGTQLRPSVPEILPLVIEAIQVRMAGDWHGSVSGTRAWHMSLWPYSSHEPTSWHGGCLDALRLS